MVAGVEILLAELVETGFGLSFGGNGVGKGQKLAAFLLVNALRGVFYCLVSVLEHGLW